MPAGAEGCRRDDATGWVLGGVAGRRHDESGAGGGRLPATAGRGPGGRGGAGMVASASTGGPAVPAAGDAMAVLGLLWVGS
jgi:hypothetical protein